jgi:hypothetical protein
MTGAICLNDKCNWYTHDIDNIKIINDEINNSAIGKKFKELEIQELMDDYEDMCGYDEI